MTNEQMQQCMTDNFGNIQRVSIKISCKKDD